MKHGLVLVLICAVGLTAGALGSSQSGELGPRDTGKSVQRGLAERYKRFALQETRRLAVRTCRRVARNALFKAFSSVDDPHNDNYIALGYAAMRLRPIPLGREAYEGCRRGLRAQTAAAEG